MELIGENDLRECSITESSHVLCAFSGGADSTALLLELYRLKNNGKICSLAAAHFEHGIRGEESKADMRFCRELAGRLEIPFFCETANVPETAEKEHVSLETAARKLRYDFLHRTAAENGYDKIALAHHAQDQAETLLFHLIRGAGLTGLTGMAPVNGVLIRPLLKRSKEELLDYLKNAGQSYCSDSTNELPEADRNRIRLCVLPSLEKINPQAVMHLSETAEKLRRENDYLESLTEQEFSLCGGRRSLIRKEPEAIRDRILLRLIREQTRDYSENDVKKLRFLLAARSGRIIELTGGIKARAEGDEIFFFREEEPVMAEISLLPGIPLKLDSGAVLLVEQTGFARLPCPGNEAYIDADTLIGSLSVRAAGKGEKLIPYGMRGSKLFSDFYTDRKVPLSRRWGPVVFDAEKPVYVCGFTVDDRVKITEKTKNYIHIMYSEGV